MVWVLLALNSTGNHVLGEEGLSWFQNSHLHFITGTRKSPAPPFYHHYYCASLLLCECMVCVLMSGVHMFVCPRSDARGDLGCPALPLYRLPR